MRAGVFKFSGKWRDAVRRVPGRGMGETVGRGLADARRPWTRPDRSWPSSRKALRERCLGDPGDELGFRVGVGLARVEGRRAMPWCELALEPLVCACRLGVFPQVVAERQRFPLL